jgi:NAD(P)-dependent dehydrogenase (short-subunit alcohol dehydrogenase family)
MADKITLKTVPLSDYRPAKPAPKDLIGVNAAIRAAQDSSFEVKPTVFDQFSLKGKVAVVTGANSGIGLEYSVLLAELGAKVYGLDLASTESKEFTYCKSYVERLKIPGVSLELRSADVTNVASIQGAIKKIAGENNGIHIAVANAGILGPIKDAHEYPADTFRKVIDVNVNGVFFTAQAAAREMLARGIKGSIIVTASMSGSIINKDMHWIPYVTSKGAAIQLTRGLACELGDAGIRVNSISPGHVRTTLLENFLQAEPLYENQWAAQNPMGRIGAVYELRGALAYLASDASSYTTGADLQVCGGHTAW